LEKELMGFLKMRAGGFLHIIHPDEDLLMSSQKSVTYVIAKDLQSYILPLRTISQVRTALKIVTGNTHTSNCIISQTRLRSAIDGWGLPSKNFASPFSHTDSILPSDCIRSFSACFTASGLVARPRKGASAVCITRVAASTNNQKGSIETNFVIMCLLETVDAHHSSEE